MVTNGASEMMNVRKFDATNNYLFDFTRGAIVKTRFNVSRKKYKVSNTAWSQCGVAVAIILHVY